jgi:hypothetical protein
MKEDNNIEDLFRSSFDHFEEAPPSAVKDAIDRRIGGSSSKRIWWVSGLLLVLGTASLLFFFNDSSGKQDATTSGKQLASNENPANSSTSTTGSHPANHHSSTAQTPASSHNQSGEKNAVSGTNNGSNNEHQPEGNTTSFPSKNNDKETVSSTTHSENKKNRSAKTTPSKGNKASGKKSAGKKPKRTPAKSTSGDLTKPLELTANELGQTIQNNVNNSNLSDNENNTAEHPNGSTNNGASDPDPIKKTDPVVPDPKENPVAPQIADSVKKEETKKKLPDDKSKKSNWLASVYAGPSFGINSKSNDELRSVSEKPSMQFSAEINRTLFAGYGLSTGFGFNQRQETFKLTNLQILDSAIVVNDSVPIYQNPQQPDTIIGWLDTTYYYDDTLSTDFTQLNRIQTISIPLYFSKHFSFTDQWGLLVNAGAVFQFNKYRTTQQTSMMLPAPTINNFSMNLTGRFHVTYTWNKWMFSAGVSTGWEMKQALMYEGLDRKRYFITPQLGFHFRF